MIKWYHILITLLIGVIIGILVYPYLFPDKSGLEDPQIGHLKQELGWRDLNEKRITKRLEIMAKDSSKQAKEIIVLRAKANRSETKFVEHRKEPIPLTAKDTISFLMEDTTLCDSALTQSKALVAGLTLEIITDNAIIKGQGELIDSLQSDKKDLLKVDSLNQIDKKKLRKANRKKFFKGLGIGGAFGAIIMALLL